MIAKALRAQFFLKYSDAATFLFCVMLWRFLFHPLKIGSRSMACLPATFAHRP
jgi:hypothetical protein